MDLIDKIRGLSERVLKLKDQIQTEEATKNAFVMPFLSALGYDVFNPLEVVPEYTADVGLKKGEKVDYCVLKDGEPAIIIECKHWNEKLDNHDSQLTRYFHVTNTRFSILTNGISYRFFTDLVEANKMDSKPFFEFSMENITEQGISELKKFHKEKFDKEVILGSASDLKYSKEIKELLAKELKDPSEEFVKYFAARIYPGRVTSKVQEQFTSLVQTSSKSLLSEMVSERLKSALASEEASYQAPVSKNEEQSANDQEAADSSEEEDGIVTTEDERQGFRIVQAILAKHMDVNRVTIRDTKSYCGVLIDDSNRQPVCRLHFNRSKKYIGLFDENKNEERVEVQSPTDIYKYESAIVKRALLYLED